MRFGPAIDLLAREGCNAFLEISPHPVLAASISQMSLATGGRPFFEVVRFQHALAEVGRQTNGYYLVSVRVGGGGAGFRDVRVSVANPEFRVSARGGFRFDPLPPDAG